MRMRFTTVFVSHADKAIDFYTNKLGFKLLADNPTPLGNRFLMFDPPGGGSKLVLTTPVPGVLDGKVGERTGVSWEVDDLQGTYEALQAKGVGFSQPPTKTPWDGAEARFEDGDGNSFMLQEGRMVR